MLFCPVCGNTLLVESVGTNRFFCPTCPYVYSITSHIERSMPLRPSPVDDVLGGAEAWKNVDATDVECPFCGNGRAYYLQIQTRSADEPTDIFYKCTKCGRRWKE